MLALQGFRHFVVDDALGETFHDGGLADTGLADQDGVVLRAPLKDLDDAANLVVAADHRIELPLAGTIGQIERVLLQRLTLALGFRALDFLAPPHRFDRLLYGLARPAVLFEEACCISLVLREGKQKQLGRDELIATLLCFLVGDVEDVAKLAGKRDLTRRPFHLRQPFQALAQRFPKRWNVDARALEQGRGSPLLLLQQRKQQMGRLDERIVLPER